MKLPAFALAFAFAVSAMPAQETPPAVKVDIKRVNLNTVQTPQFNVGNVPEKRWRPKNWVEVDVEFDVKLPPASGGNKGSYPALQMNIYLALNHTTADGKKEVIQGTLDLVNIPAGDNHALAFVSPATMSAIFMKPNIVVNTDIQGWGVEVYADGQRIAGDSSLGRDPWWETKKDAFAFLQGMLLNKKQTPFAPLWDDYDVQVRAK